MTMEPAEGAVQAVVLYDGQLLLVARDGEWVLPSGAAEPAESAEATAARVVYELTGYLVDGTESLTRRDTTPADGPPAVLCQLLSHTPSDEAALASAQVRWTPIPETAGAALPAAVRDYLQGHKPV